MSKKVAAILAALRGSEEKAPRPKYLHTQAYYAKLYAVDVRTIKRWCNEGRPLDDEQLTREMMSPKGRKVDPPAEEEGERVQGRAAPEGFGASFSEQSGLLASVDRLERAEQERARAYAEAVAENQPAAMIQNRFKEWLAIVDALRKLAIDVPAIEKANDRSVAKSEVEAAVGLVFSAFRAATRSLPTRAAAKLLAARGREEFISVLEGEVEVLLRTLTDIAVTERDRAAGLPAAVPSSPPPPPQEEKAAAAKKKARAKK